MSLKSKLKIYIQKYNRFLNIYSMFVSIFIFKLFFIFQGLDVADFGYHMTHQMLSFSLSPGVKYISPMIFLTDFVGGMWLSIIGHPSVLWARMGGLLLEALNAAIIFSILENYFERKKVFFVVFISSLFLSIYVADYIHYYTFPAFLTNIGLWIFNKVISSSNWSKKNEIYSFLLGFIIIPIILGRFTLILIFILPLLFIIYYYTRKKEAVYLRKMIPPFIKGVFFSIIFFGLLYWYLGILNYYFSNIFDIMFASAKDDSSKVGSSHTMGFLFQRYIQECISVTKSSLIVILVIYVLSIINKRIGEKRFNIFITFLTILSIVFLLRYSYLIEMSLFYFLKVFIGIILILSFIYFIFKNTRNENIDLLLISSILIMIINPIGSDTGFWKAYYGMWLTLPLALLCIYKTKTDIKNTRISSMLSLETILIMFLLCLSIFFTFTCVYRDDINRLNLDTEFSDPSLKGIYSTSSRVEVVDQLVYQMKIYSNKNDEILIVNDIPLFYYLTETKPSLGEPWLFLKSLDEIEEKQRELENKNELPKLFIYSKINTEVNGWPDSRINDYEDDNEKLRYLKTRYINDMNYTLLWEDEAFAIYGRPSA